MTQNQEHPSVPEIISRILAVIITIYIVYSLINNQITQNQTYAIEHQKEINQEINNKQIALHATETSLVIGKTTKQDIIKYYEEEGFPPEKELFVKKTKKLETLKYRTAIGTYQFTFENDILLEWKKYNY